MKELFISTVFARKEYLRAIYLGTFDGHMYEWGVMVGAVIVAKSENELDMTKWR